MAPILPYVRSLCSLLFIIKFNKFKPILTFLLMSQILNFYFQILKPARKLELQVRNVGRVPGSFETHQAYTWVDPNGRSVSPPPEIDRVGRYEAGEQRKSGLMLLKDSDERKVGLSKTICLKQVYNRMYSFCLLADFHPFLANF